MILQHPLFRNNARIHRAAQNAPAMFRGESDREAVVILQNALIANGAATMRRSIANGELDGDYGSETHEGVKRFQIAQGLTDTRGNADGIAGRNTWLALDRETPMVPAPINLTPGSTAVTPPAESPTTTRAPAGARLPRPDDMLREYRRFRQGR